MKRRTVKSILSLIKLINMTDNIEVFHSIGWYVTYKEVKIYFSSNKDMYNFLFKIINK